MKNDLFVCVCTQAYSLVDREVGYCQGSAFIVGLLLMQVRVSGIQTGIKFNVLERARAV